MDWCSHPNETDCNHNITYWLETCADLKMQVSDLSFSKCWFKDVILIHWLRFSSKSLTNNKKHLKDIKFGQRYCLKLMILVIFILSKSVYKNKMIAWVKTWTEPNTIEDIWLSLASLVSESPNKTSEQTVNSAWNPIWKLVFGVRKQ